jgi:hypothetical protein
MINVIKWVLIRFYIAFTLLNFAFTNLKVTFVTKYDLSHINNM